MKRAQWPPFGNRLVLIDASISDPKALINVVTTGKPRLSASVLLQFRSRDFQQFEDALLELIDEPVKWPVLKDTAMRHHAVLISSNFARD
jgi:hypothetical protein